MLRVAPQLVTRSEILPDIDTSRRLRSIVRILFTYSRYHHEDVQRCSVLSRHFDHSISWKIDQPKRSRAAFLKRRS